jgi:hypothetical protein
MFVSKAEYEVPKELGKTGNLRHHTRTANVYPEDIECDHRSACVIKTTMKVFVVSSFAIQGSWGTVK